MIDVRESTRRADPHRAGLIGSKRSDAVIRQPAFAGEISPAAFFPTDQALFGAEPNGAVGTDRHLRQVQNGQSFAASEGIPAASAVGEIESLVRSDEKIVAAKPGQRADFRAQQAGRANFQPEPVWTLARARKKSRLSGNEYFIRADVRKT